MTLNWCEVSHDFKLNLTWHRLVQTAQTQSKPWATAGIPGMAFQLMQDAAEIGIEDLS